MADLFLSYAREDRECAELVARALASRGWSVWWDRRIHVGRPFSEVIEHELEQARCVIVLWSRHSVRSLYVQSEAAEAARRNVLVPIRIDDVRPPLDFRRLHTADFLQWRDGFESPEFEVCLESIEILVRKTASGAVPVPPSLQHEHQQTGFWISQDGQEFTAPDLPTLRRWVDEGRVRADSSIYAPRLQRWVPVRELAARESVESGQPNSPPRQASERASSHWWIWTAVGAGILVLIIISSIVMLSMYLQSRRSEITATDSAVTETAATDSTVTDTTATESTVNETTSGDSSAADTSAAEAQTASESRPDEPRQATATSRRKPVAISLSNRCPGQTINVAICYRDRFNSWTSQGWYTIEPGETRTNVVEAKGADVYFFGLSAEMAWHSRTGEPLAREVPVSMKEGFFVLPANKLPTKEYPLEPFFGRKIDSDESTYTEIFTCENGERWSRR